MAVWQISSAGYRTLCVCHAQSADEALAKARRLFGDLVIGCNPAPTGFETRSDRVWLEIE